MSIQIPYLMNLQKPYARSQFGYQQYPISVIAGVPLIGTAFSAMGTQASKAAALLATRLRHHLTLEFHALDLLGLVEDGLDPQLAVQPDLKVPLERKYGIFREVLNTVAKRCNFVRLDRLTESKTS